jgi:hypothetical protein
VNYVPAKNREMNFLQPTRDADTNDKIAAAAMVAVVMNRGNIALAKKHELANLASPSRRGQEHE